MPVVDVYVGVGAWTTYKRVRLAACPHTGDNIEVGDVTVQCDVVVIGQKYIQVRSKHRFESEQDAIDFFKPV